MSLRSGAVIGGRFRLVSERPAADGQWRWSTDADVEVVAPDRSAVLRPGARDRFVRAQSAAPAEPAWLATTFVGEHEGHPVAVRPTTAGPWPMAMRLDSGQALDLASWLAPAIASGATALDGELTPADIVVLEDGAVALQPAGLVRQVSIARPARYRAPEWVEGAQPSAAAALYGLGVVLFEAVTGTAPAPARTAEQLTRSQRTPLRARAVVPDVDETLDDLLAALLDPDPARRLSAVADLPRVARSPRVSLPAAAYPVSSPTTDVQPPVDLARGRWVAVVDPLALPTRARRDLAALVGVPQSAVDRAADDRLPVIVAAGDDRAAALRAAAPATRLGLTIAAEPMAASVLGPRAARGIAWTVGALALATIAAAALAAVGLGIVGIGLALLTGVVGVGVTGRRVARRLARSRRIELGSRRLRELGNNPEQQESRRLSAARRVILEAGLPSQVQGDLLDIADEIADRLSDREDIATRAAAARRIDGLEQAARAAAGSDRLPEDSALSRAAAAARAASHEVGGG